MATRIRLTNKTVAPGGQEVLDEGGGSAVVAAPVVALGGLDRRGGLHDADVAGLRLGLDEEVGGVPAWPDEEAEDSDLGLIDQRLVEMGLVLSAPVERGSDDSEEAAGDVVETPAIEDPFLRA